MPTLPRRPAAQRERDRLQARRLCAGDLFAAGVRQAEVARQLGVSAQAISVWHARWQTGGTEGLQSRGPSGPAPRLSDTQLAQVEQALPEGATAHGFVGELWTLDRIATVIERLTGVHHHPAWVWALLHHRLGWTVQRPNGRQLRHRHPHRGAQRAAPLPGWREGHAAASRDAAAALAAPKPAAGLGRSDPRRAGCTAPRSLLSNPLSRWWLPA